MAKRPKAATPPPDPLTVAVATELKTRRAARTNLLAFTKYTMPLFRENWHHKVIADELERIENGENDRLMVWAPPRHTKSELVSIRRPAWSIGKSPQRMFINVTYGADLAATFSRACSRTIMSDAYQRLFKVTFSGKPAVERWKINRPAELENQRDSMIASGIMSPLTGEGATDINVDDPFKNKSEAYSKLHRDRVHDEYQTSIRTRLQPGGSIILTLTRWHQDDLAGRLIKAALKNPLADQWRVLCLAATNDSGEDAYIWDTRTNTKTYFPKYAALWPGDAKNPWFPRAILDATKAGTSTVFWEAMYMQRPTAAAGNIFKEEKWREFNDDPGCDRRIHVWDTAMEDNEDADYSAHIIMGLSAGRFVIPSAYRGRLTFPDLVAEVYQRWEADIMRGHYPERLLIEQKGSGISLIQIIEGNNMDPGFDGPRIPVLGMPATINKTLRALSVAGYHEACLEYLPEKPLYGDDEWQAELIEEHKAFDKGVNDDWVDCNVHGLTYFTRPISGDEEEQIMVDHEDVTISDELDLVDYR